MINSLPLSCNQLIILTNSILKVYPTQDPHSISDAATPSTARSACRRECDNVPKMGMKSVPPLKGKPW